MLTGILPQWFLQTSPSTTSFHRKQQVNSKETTRDASCYRSQPNVVFWRWKDLYTITELPSFPVPRVCFQGKQNLFQITPDIFFPAQQLHLRMFSRCLCLYETYNNKIVNRRRQYPDCKKELPGKAWKLTSPHTKSTCSHQWDDEDIFYWPFWRTTTFLCKWAHKICPVSPVASGGLFVFGEQIPCTWADGVWNNVKPNCNYSEKKENVVLWSASFEKKNKREENPCSKWKVRWWKQICCTRAVKFPGQKLDLRYHLYWNHKEYQMRVPCLRHPQSEMSPVFKSCLIRDE